MQHWTQKIDVGDVDAFTGLLDIGIPFGLLVTTRDFTPAARNRALNQGAPNLDVDVVPFDDLALWRPRNPTVAITSGTNMATFTYRDEHGSLRTEIVDPDLARRMMEDLTPNGRDDEEVR